MTAARLRDLIGQSFPILILLLIGLGSVGPVLLLGFWNLGFAGLGSISHAALSFINEAFLPCANSVVVGIIVGSVGTVLSWWIVFRTNGEKVLIAFVIVLLFFPGLATALGLDYAVRQVARPSFTSSLKSLALLVSLVGYVLPYQLIVALNSRVLLKSSEICASAELMTYFEQRFYLGRRLIFPSVSMLMIGLALCFTENQRFQILGTDVAGFGSQYFGPWLLGRSQSAGIALSVFSITAVVFSCGMLVVIWSQYRSAPARSL